MYCQVHLRFKFYLQYACKEKIYKIYIEFQNIEYINLEIFFFFHNFS